MRSRVATGYGQPPATFYDWTLTQGGGSEEGFRLPPDTQGRLLIEKFSNRVTKALYSNHSDPVGLAKDSERSVLTRFLARDYEHLDQMHQQYESSRMSYQYYCLDPVSWLPMLLRKFFSQVLTMFVLSYIFNGAFVDLLTFQPSPRFTFAPLVYISACLRSLTPQTRQTMPMICYLCGLLRAHS